MNHWHFSWLFTANGWQKDCYIDCDDSGKISKLSSSPSSRASAYKKIDGLSLPAFHNAHSHAFQYAMAGLGETFPKNSGSDDFWSWRQSMYELALRVSPADVETIASMLYLRMLKAGYSRVAEFHYLHKNHDGSEYKPLSQMSLSLCRAAEKVGIGLTLIPVYYQSSTFGKPAVPNQRRFVFDNVKEYLKLIDELRESFAKMNHVKLGLGVHSLRAATIEEVNEIAEYRTPDEVFHIHVSEQLKEVEECQSYYGKRPVELLLDRCANLKNFFLVHATHLDDSELSRLASSDASVVLCPTTEANLGDGLFPLSQFCQADGKFCIGSDSHITIDPFEELRWLDYGQRLKTRKRLSIAGIENPADYLMNQCWANGARALGIGYNSNALQIGAELDVVTIDHSHPLLCREDPKTWLATIMYALGRVKVESVLVRGHQCIVSEVHSNEVSIYNDFAKFVRK